VSAPPVRLREGSGAPVVLLNGGMMSYPAWEPIAAILRDRFEVLRFDFRGQLLAPGAPPDDLAGHAADVVDHLDAEGWESAHVVAASFGALVAIELAARAPGRVRSLTLMVAMDRSTPEWRRESDAMRGIVAEVIAGGARAKFYDTLVEGVYSKAYRESHAAILDARRAQIDLLPVEWFRGVDAILAVVEEFDLTSRIAAIRCPALVIDAAHDRVMSAVRSHALATALGARHLVHPRSGHALVAEDPQWVGESCLAHLTELEQGGR